MRLTQLCAAGVLALAAAAPAQQLNPRIEAAAANHKLGSATWGVFVLDLETGAAVADIRGKRPLIPASNMKLLTSGAALLVLGQDFRFRTELVMDGTRLVVKGSGDPALGDPALLAKMDEKLTVDGLLERLAKAVKSAGVDTVSEVILDDRVFDRELVHPTWPKDQLDKWYCAPVSGLNFHTNVISVFPSPSSLGVGHPPSYSVQPAAPWLELVNKARTIGGSKNTVWLAKDPAANRYTMFGEVSIPVRVGINVTVTDPALFAGRLLAGALSGAGVECSPENVRLATRDERFDGRTVAVVSTGMEDALARCNGDSHNLYAEAFIKRIGYEVTREPGSWSNGSSVMRMKLAEPARGWDGPAHASTTQVADGSGMSREDRVSPWTLAKWMDRLKDEPMFVASLASDEDKLKSRFQDRKLTCEVRAKTGLINGVRCLSGYVIDPSTGRRAAFSVMVNGLKDPSPEVTAARDFHEDVVMIVDRWLAGPR